MATTREPRMVFVTPDGKVSATPQARMWVRIERGGVQQVRYDCLPPDRRVEWDAFEEVLLRLGLGKAVYVAGRFRSRPEGEWYQTGREGEWFLPNSKGDGVVYGMWRVQSRDSLHKHLTEDVLGFREWLVFLVTPTALPSDEAVRVAKHMDRHGALGRAFSEWCPNAYCGMAEGDDFNGFDLTCRSDAVEEVVGVIKAVLRQYHIDDP
ncbi:MAG: hypothetical protein IMZ65_00780 [Planctomycetes bacterium]|nr:hypothetical protein [Planctomycetota bacterium]